MQTNLFASPYQLTFDASNIFLSYLIKKFINQILILPEEKGDNDISSRLILSSGSKEK